MAHPSPTTLGALKDSGWAPKSVRAEMRHNLIEMLKRGASVEERWPGVLGYEQTVIPQIENALLSQHDFILLGLRGQAKTRILRMMTRFLDPWLPALAGTALREDPFAPITRQGGSLRHRVTTSPSTGSHAASAITRSSPRRM